VLRPNNVPKFKLVVVRKPMAAVSVLKPMITAPAPRLMVIARRISAKRPAPVRAATSSVPKPSVCALRKKVVVVQKSGADLEKFF
jgi:hypothetical protein